MKKIILLLSLLAFSVSAFSQGNTAVFSQEGKKAFTPKAGDFAFGLTFNPVSLSNKGKFQPSLGEDFSGGFVKEVGSHPHEMYILALDPVIGLSFRYRVADKWSIKGKFGLTGSEINHKEYVQDDAAVKIDPKSLNKVTDVVTGSLNAFSFGLGMEFNKQVKSLQFNAGFGLLYAIAGGSMDFTYGNAITSENPAPSTMPMTRKPGGPEDKTLNEYQPNEVADVAWARPLRRYNTGYTNGIGLTLDMGLEWFFSGNMSIGASVTITPIMALFQPQTFTKFEGFNGSSGSVMEYTRLVSPGSNGFIYGTDNFGLCLSFSYYL